MRTIPTCPPAALGRRLLLLDPLRGEVAKRIRLPLRGGQELPRTRPRLGGREKEGGTQRARIGRRRAAAVATELLLLPGRCEGDIGAWLLLLRCGREESWLLLLRCGREESWLLLLRCGQEESWLLLLRCGREESWLPLLCGREESWLLLLRCGREEAWLGPRGMFLAPV